MRGERSLWGGMAGDSVFLCLGAGDSEEGAKAHIENDLSPKNGRRSHV